MDDPYLIGEDKFVIWYWNGIRWPDGARVVGYLTNKLSPRGYRLTGDNYATAMTFDSADAAFAILKKDSAKRTTLHLRVTTVAELRAAVGFPGATEYV